MKHPMPTLYNRIKFTLLWGLCVVGGMASGFLIQHGMNLHWSITGPSRDTRMIPLPHQVPADPGGTALRFAMVHDVLVNRYPTHSDAWYRRRNENVREKLSGRRSEEATPESDAEWQKKIGALYDDLGVGLSRLGKHGAAIRVLRKKRNIQKRRGIEGRDLYTTYANLGTVIIHGHLQDAMRGNRDARNTVRKGLGLLRKAVEVNPDAHFGRETWQVVFVEFLLRAMENPDLLTRYDAVGNRLDESVSPARGSSLRERRSYVRHVRFNGVDETLHPDTMSERREIRKQIRWLVRGEGWLEAMSVDRPVVPFDRPVLGIVGMWRLGGGPNPHFALALGEIMLRVGQRHIAWEAYERALRMKNQFWPDPAVRRKWVAHCRQRQHHIEATFSRKRVTEMKRTFNAERRHARSWQQAYRAFERERLRNGHDLTDPSFHDPFFEKHGPISTEPGRADWLRVERTVYDPSFVTMPLVWLLGGVFGLTAGLLIYYRKAPKNS